MNCSDATAPGRWSEIPRALTLLAVLTLAACGSDGSPASPSSPSPPATTAGSTYLAQVLAAMQANSINHHTIDWTSFRQTVNQAAPNPQTITDTYPAISVALGLLGDHHSYFVKPDGSYILNSNPYPPCSDADAPTPTVPSSIGYVRVVAFVGSSSSNEAMAFAVGLQSQIALQDSRGVDGWIIDVRGNSGGSMYPMITGVGPLLGDGTAGAFIDADNKTTLWAYANGAASLGGSTLIQVPAPYTMLKPSPRVAVLTDCHTASSGEATVISFRRRPNTRSFGTPTRGLSTANGGFSMSDGGNLVLTTATMADRNLTPFGGQVVPDETIGSTPGTVERAIQWIRSF